MMKEAYHLPARLYDRDGQLRRAGFEFEVGNLPVTGTARALQEALGGELDSHSPFEAVLRDSKIGKLKIERDAALLKSMKYRSWLEKLGVDFAPGGVAHGLESNLDNASRNLVPCEVVTGPLSFLELSELDILVDTLASMGAEGTGSSPFYAFGMHINASIPDASADTLRRYIQSYLLLNDWIILVSDIDVTRRFFTKYIDPYPEEYEELLLDPGYRPDLGALIDDYLEHNPTRNRALDMLPIFYHLQPERVLEGVKADERHLVSGRPAFHYRLPDCNVNEPGWHAAPSWNQWVCVENLASDEELLLDLIDQWQRNREKYSLARSARWVLRLTHLLAKKYLAG
jgi:hypothetical protein